MKKWSYVAVAMMALASSAALTSCIDNDEPFGIREIRQATANLLDAKKAAVEAEAAAKSAQVEIAKINAEIEKLRIENEKIMAQANADYRAAEARYLDALAEAERLRAEADKAVSDAEAAKKNAEAEIALAKAEKLKAEADKIRTEADANYQEKMQQIARAQQDAANAQRYADQKYAEAVYRFEQKKAENANTANTNLWNDVNYAFGEYLKTVEAYNQANKSLMEALNEMAAIEADLVWREKGELVEERIPYYDWQTGETKYTIKTYVVDASGFYCPSYDKKRAIILQITAKQRLIDTYEETITIYDEFLTKFDEFQQGDWAQLLEEYKQKLADADVAVAQAKLEQEAVKLDQKDVYDKPDQIQEQINAIKYSADEQIEIAAFTIDPIDELSAINKDWSNPIEVVPENVKYNVTNSKDQLDLSPVSDYKDAFNGWIKSFTMAQFDANDIAWTEATLAELKRQAANDEPYKKAEELWQMAKKAYNMGGEPDASALPLADELDAAIDAYNAYGDKISEAIVNKADADKKASETYKTWQDLLTSYNGGELPGNLTAYRDAKEAYDDAIKEAKEIRDKAVGLPYYYDEDNNKWYYTGGTLQVERDNELQKIANHVTTLRNNVTIKNAEYNAAKAAAEADPKNETLATAAGKAEEAAKAAQQELNKYTQSTIVEGEDGTQEVIPSPEEQAKGAVTKAYENALDAALDAYNKAVAEAHNTFLEAEDKFLTSGGVGIPENDPAYKPVADAEAAYKAALEDQREAGKVIDKLKDEILPLVKPMHDAVKDQYKEMGYKNYNDLWTISENTCIPSVAMVRNYINSSDPDVEFPQAVAPVMFLNASNQVYVNAKNFVIATSRMAYGNLGSNDLEKEYDQNWIYTYDLLSDDAFLIDEVTVETLNMYITKMLIKNGMEEKDINPFIISGYYSWFGLFGAQADVLEKISRAEICLADGAENAIKAQIDKLVAARDKMIADCEDQMAKLKKLEDEWTDASQAVTDLDKKAADVVKNAEYIQRAYQNIVDDLDAYVKKLENKEFEDFYDGDYGVTAESIKKKLKDQIETEKDLLANAKEALEYYQYQLQQYESDDYAKVENPWVYEVEYLKKYVAKCEEAMNFAKARYEELQAKYDAANKQE